MSGQTLGFSDVNAQAYDVGGRAGLPVACVPLPKGAVPLYASSGNVANAVAAATLTGQAGQETWLEGFSITGSGSTTALPVSVTLTGLQGGTLTFTYVFIAGVLLANQALVIMFPTPLKASAVAGSIAVSCPAGGAGNTNNTANIFGYAL